MRLRMQGAALAVLGMLSSQAHANEDVLKQTADPKQWAKQEGDYANTRYS